MIKINLSEEKAREEIVIVGRRMYEKGLIVANDGNISVRLDDKHILVTPSGVCKGFLKNYEIVKVNLSGNPIGIKKNPTSELVMHLAIYKTRPDIVAIVHAHPIFATAFAAAGIPLDKNVLTEVVMAIGKIPLTRYGTPGTEEIAEVVNEKIIDNDAVLLANHGVVTVGKDVFDAYYKMERVEHYANIIFVARLLGGEKELSKEDIKKICKNCD